MSSIQIPDNDTSIVSLSRRVTTSLTDLAEKVNAHLDEHDTDSTRFTLEDEIERFKIWKAEHAVDHGKLDHRLREASVLRVRVLELLKQLCDLSFESLSDSKYTVSDDAVDASPDFHEQAIPSLEDGVQAYQNLDERVTEDDGSSSIDTDISFPASVPESPAAKAHDIITLLMELGHMLVDPAPQDRLLHFSHSDAGYFDERHIEEKFQKADNYLVRRLGRANWQRRQYFSSLRDKEQNVTGSRYEITDFEERDDAFDTSDSGSDSSQQLARRLSLLPVPEPATDLPSTATTSTGSAQMSSFRDEGYSSLRQTRSTALTEISDSLSAGKRDRKDAPTRYRIPPPSGRQNPFSGESFRCTYCAHVLTNVKTYQEWKSHVLDDIQPYMCTYEDCPTAATTYGSHKVWWEHEKQQHRTEHSWQCRPCKDKGSASVFYKARLFDEHIKSCHPTLSTKPQLRNIRTLCQQENGAAPPQSKCPLCKVDISYGSGALPPSFERAVRRHIADHLEQLAFFVAFPPTGESDLNDDDSIFQDDSDSEEDFKGEIRSVASKDTHLSMKNINTSFVENFISTLPKPEKLLDPRSSGRPARIGSKSDKHATERKSPEFPVRVIAHPENEHFYARQEVLHGISGLLNQPGRICVLQGVGGVGKTIAAVQYVYTSQPVFDAIFWMQADTAPGRSDSYFQLALALELVNGSEEHVQVMERARTWLETTDKRWLLVFDNTTQWDQISEYLPNQLKQTKGSVLITTQTEGFLPPSDNVTEMRLHTLSSDVGADMLLRYLGRDTNSDPERYLAKEISTFVGGLPVAIAHAAGYIAYSDYDLAEVIETFREWRKREGIATDEADDLPASFREAAVSYNDILAMVWNVVLRELSQDCTDVINLLSFLNSEAIPEKIIWGVHEDPILDFLDVREKTRHRRTKRSLVERRLLLTKTVDGELCYSMHRSLQRGLREGISANNAIQQKIFDQAVALIREVFPRSNPLQQPTPNQWVACQRLLPHLHALRDVYLGRYRSSQPAINGGIDFAQLLTDAGMDQFERGITKEGLLLLKTAEDVLQASSPEDHQVMRADIHAMIAILYDNTGISKRQEALDRRETALALRRKVFDEAATPQRKDEILVYNSEMEYAMALLHFNRYQQAEPYIEKCLKKYQEWGPEEEYPFEYAKYYNKIALVRMYQGRFDEAIDFAQKGVALMEKKGYMIFASRFNFDLACIILQSGDVDRALKVHNEILAQRIEDLGQSNELTLHSIYAIGAIHELKSEWDEAERMFRRAVEQRRALTSWPEEAFSRAQYHLSRVLEAKDHPEDAAVMKVLHERSRRVLYRLLPLDHPPELEGVTDEAVLFDHLSPISPGGTRFTGRGLLPYFMQT